MGGEEINFVTEAFNSNWIAPLGPNVNGFEDELSEYLKISNVAALTSGTAAIHLALIIHSHLQNLRVILDVDPRFVQILVISI